jgi:hypothetical protein
VYGCMSVVLLGCFQQSICYLNFDFEMYSGSQKAKILYFKVLNCSDNNTLFRLLCLLRNHSTLLQFQRNRFLKVKLKFWQIVLPRLNYAPQSPQLIRRTNSELKTPEKKSMLLLQIMSGGCIRYWNWKKQRALEATDISAKCTDCNNELEVKESNVYGFAV